MSSVQIILCHLLKLFLFFLYLVTIVAYIFQLLYLLFDHLYRCFVSSQTWWHLVSLAEDTWRLLLCGEDLSVTEFSIYLFFLPKNNVAYSFVVRLQFLGQISQSISASSSLMNLSSSSSFKAHSYKIPCSFLQIPSS